MYSGFLLEMGLSCGVWIRMDNPPGLGWLWFQSWVLVQAHVCHPPPQTMQTGQKSERLPEPRTFSQPPVHIEPCMFLLLYFTCRIG